MFAGDEKLLPSASFLPGAIDLNSPGMRWLSQTWFPCGAACSPAAGCLAGRDASWGAGNVFDRLGSQFPRDPAQGGEQRILSLALVEGCCQYPACGEFGRGVEAEVFPSCV